MLALVGTMATCGCRTAPVATSEASVQPGVNDAYLKPDLNLTQAVERFEREGREVYDRRAEILKVARLRPGMRVADIGAGTGLFTFPFAEAVGPKGRVYAVDIAEPFVRHIEARARDHGLTQVRGVVCSVREVGLDPDAIELAFICDTYHHFEYPLSTLASLRQALKPGGEVLVVDFKRVPGESSEWVLNHVRAGQETTEAEFARAGFVKVGEELDLRDNYVVRFRSTRR
jgi:ubiquinone/menaquinone biosynthesis C-methylase UbiE